MEKLSGRYAPLLTYVERVGRQIGATASAVYVWRRGEVTDWYRGEGIGPSSRFHVHSVRKSYIGLALALAQQDDRIGGLDERVGDYLPYPTLGDTTLRHLVTNTHGLSTDAEGNIVRDHPAGANWQYVNTGIDLLLELVKQQTGQSVSELITERVLKPHGFQETGWVTEETLNSALTSVQDLAQDLASSLVPDVYSDGSRRLQVREDRNLYVSARELAKWGLLHLPREGVYGRVTAVQTPSALDEDLPRNGYCWYVQDGPCGRTEIGEYVPDGSFQILGVNGCAVLVIPALDTVAVRMYNKIGNPPGYHYLRDIRDFGNLVATLSR